MPVPWWRAAWPSGGAKRALMGVGVALIAAAVYAGYWMFMADQLRAGIEKWAGERRAEGYEVSYGTLTIGGFPLRLTVALASPEMASPKGPGSWTWKGPALLFTMRPWRLTRIKAEASGLHQVSVMAPGGPEYYFIDAVALRGKVRTRRGAAERIRLTAVDVVIRNGADEDVAGAATLDIAVDGIEEKTGLALAVEAKGVLLPREPIAGLGRKTARLGFEAQVTGDFPDIARRMPVNGETMARWRDSGGTLEIRRLEFSHGPLTVSGDGTLALDQAMQPIGSFTFRVEGYLETLDRFRDAGLIKPASHAIAKAVLGVMAGKQGADGSAGLKVPLTLQDRRVFVGPVPLAALPLLRWR